MTKPRGTKRERRAEAAADPEPEVRPEIISDLDPAIEDADHIVGGMTCRPPDLGLALSRTL